MKTESYLQEVLERHADTEERPWADSWQGRCEQESWEDKQYLIDQLNAAKGIIAAMRDKK
jgi:hypothetical protein